MYSIDQEHVTEIEIKPEFKHLYTSHPNWYVGDEDSSYPHSEGVVMLPSYYPNLAYDQVSKEEWEDDYKKMEQWILDKYNVESNHIVSIMVGA